MNILPSVPQKNISEFGSCGGDTAEQAPYRFHKLPFDNDTADDIPCCGRPSGPASSRFETPGFQVCNFVNGFIDTAVGPVPSIKTSLSLVDHIGTTKVRIGFSRNDYKVAPGLYAIGKPGPDSPVLVTANYKLTFDTLRKNTTHLNIWLLVIDTRGINVWCAAGKGSFSEEEIIRRVKKVKLDRVVSHRKLILPQLCANGVAGHKVKKGCGFGIIWGPIRAEDILPFINNEMSATKAMRLVTFSLAERAVLVPVEVSLMPKTILYLLFAFILISGIHPGIYSFTMLWERGIIIGSGYIAGILAGAVVTPLFLPWIPGKAFSLKGAFTGFLFSVVVSLFFWNQINGMEAAAIYLIATTISSYMAMNFTGTTPFTSPTGVEKEMKRAIPAQLVSAVWAVVFWVGSVFL